MSYSHSNGAPHAWKSNMGCRVGAAGLPIGLQLMGRPWEEANLLYASSVLESAVKPLMRMPTVSYDILSSQQ